MSDLGALSHLVAAVAGGALSLGLDRALRDRPRHPQSLAELLPYAFQVGERTVLLKDGSFLSAWRYRGPDAVASTPALRANIAERLEHALAPFGTGWLFHFHTVRRPEPLLWPPGHFSDPLTAYIDEVRRRQLAGAEHLLTQHYLCATFQPPAGLERHVSRLLVDRSASGSGDLSHFLELLSEFEDRCRQLADRLRSAVAVTPLSHAELLAHLAFCIDGQPRRVRSAADSYLDLVLARFDLAGGYYPRLGDQHLRVLSLTGLPNETVPDLLRGLHQAGFSYRLVNRFQPLDASHAERAIGQIQNRWFTARFNFRGLAHTATQGDTPDPHAALFERGAAVAMAQDAAAAATRASQGTRFGLWTQSLIVFDPDAGTADRRVRELSKALTEAGLTTRLEAVNVLDAWQGSLPGNGSSNLRASLLSLPNLTHLVGLTDLWPGETACPNRMFPPESPPVLFTSTDLHSPFRLHLHHGDVGHTLVLGPTGSGKSTLVALLVAGFLRYESSRAVVFDVGGSYELFALAAGVPHHKIGVSESPIHFQPLRRIDEPRERLWAADWLELLFSLQGTPLSAEDRGSLGHALELLASEPAPHRTLSVLEVHLPHHLKAALRPYTAAGTWGAILDASEDGIADARLQIFEIRFLLEFGDAILLPTLLYIFHAVEALLTGPPALLVLEEAWLPLAKPAFRETAIKWLRTLRKANASVLLVTQSLSELAALPEAQLLFESCPTRICLPNPAASTSVEARALYTTLGFNDSEIAVIAGAAPKREYYLQKPEGSRLFELGLPASLLAFLSPLDGQSLPATIREAAALRDQLGSRWPAAWLRQLGHEAEAALFLEQLKETHG